MKAIVFLSQKSILVREQVAKKETKDEECQIE